MTKRRHEAISFVDLPVGLVPDGLIMLAEVGSRAHGTWLPKEDPNSIDDVDLMGVFVGPIEAYLGFGRQETYERKFGDYGVFDCVSYDVRHFISLLMKSNPNVLGTIWMSREHVIASSPFAELLIENRKIFATKYAYKSFAGYASAQLHRMTHFDGPARRKMMEIEAELERRHIPLNYTPEELLEARKNLYRERGSLKGGEKESDRPYIHVDGATLLMDYRQMCNKYTSGYMGKKRRELVDTFGYDTKNAAHLIRLLTMAIEFLNEGELYVDRTGRDADTLIAIKRGEWTLEQVKQRAEELFALAKIARDKSPLPEEPNREAAEALCVEIISRYHGVTFK